MRKPRRPLLGRDADYLGFALVNFLKYLDGSVKVGVFKPPSPSERAIERTTNPAYGKAN